MRQRSSNSMRWRRRKERSQGEVWLLTVPLVSWRQGFVGDPLYNPFKMMPRVKREDLKADGVLRGAYEEMGK